jgi:hypothetical protein
VGPAGSLLASGKLGARERVLVADFRAVGDTTLGGVVAEAVRADLVQSSVVSPVPVNAISAARQRMRVAPDRRLDLPLAREVALREGVKAVVDGEVHQLGTSYLVTVRLVAADSGQELVSYRATASGPEEIIATIGKLTRRLRGKVGESLRRVNASPTLEQVSTASLPALQRYTAANQALARDGDLARFVRLMEEAIALDTGFAMAYRRLAVELANSGGQQERAEQLLQQAYQHRDRLTDFERYITEGSYFSSGPVRVRDARRALAAYELAIEARPDYPPAINNAALMHSEFRNFAVAESLYRRAAVLNPGNPVRYQLNLVSAQLDGGRPAAAAATLASIAPEYDDHPDVITARAEVAYAQGQLDSAVRIASAGFDRTRSNGTARDAIARQLASFALLQGRLAEWRRWRAAAGAAAAERGVASAGLLASLDEASVAGWILRDTIRARRVVDSALAVTPLAALPEAERPYELLARVYAITRQPERASAMAAQAAQRIVGARDPLLLRALHDARGAAAIAAGRYDAAVAELREADVGTCMHCEDVPLAYAYDLAGNADSARAVLARYVDRPFRSSEHAAFHLAGALKRLAELSEAGGDRARAARSYGELASLWARADRALQPDVAAARERLARLESR